MRPLPSPDDLDLLPTEDLLAAIARRTTACLVVWMRDLGRDVEERDLFHYGLIPAVGLARWAEASLLRIIEDRDRERDDGRMGE